MRDRRQWPPRRRSPSRNEATNPHQPSVFRHNATPSAPASPRTPSSSRYSQESKGNLLDFGLPVTPDQYLACVHKKNLLKHDFTEEEIFDLVMPVPAQENGRLDSSPRTTREKAVVSEDAERRTIRLIRDSGLGIDEDIPAMWSWDQQHGPGFSSIV
ncbi:hypothetical protein OF83DRAFT_1178801 [Amylostereum chailletii]|nr:hypothetical protein OF83DRAFT_1178801 [Amylostereum chailletii]